MAKKQASKSGDGRAVVVTTQFRGVFFGYLAEDQGDTVTLKRARNCVYWARSIGGFLGLVATGPNAECKIGATADSLTLRGVASVSDCTPEAEKAWLSAPTLK